MSPQRENRRRPTDVRRERLRVLVICGGRRTERDYLDGLKAAYLTRATVQIKAKGNDPARCIDYAVAQGRAGDPAYDEIWCVVDVDEFPIAEAVRHGERRNVSLAISNPCFEVWLLLHLSDASREFSDAKDVLRELRKFLPGYDKTRLVFGDFAAGVEDAVKRAQWLESTGKQDIPNPSSGMWRLVTRIVGEGRG
jgi:RloB-like protein